MDAEKASKAVLDAAMRVHSELYSATAHIPKVEQEKTGPPTKLQHNVLKGRHRQDDYFLDPSRPFESFAVGQRRRT